MRAFMVPEFGATGSIGERPTPEPAEGQVLIRVRAASVNAMDPVFRAGWFKDYMEHRLPLTPGLDYAGTVEAVGRGVEDSAIGDEVFGAVAKPYAGEGSFAEYVTVNASRAAKRPADLPVEVAAALPTAGGTALAVVDALAAAEGDRIAIIGAAGGVGAFAVQLAAQRGYRVIAVTRGDQADFVRGLGAADVVDYTAGDIAEQLRALAPEGLAGIADLFHEAEHAAPLAALVRPGGAIVSPIANGIDQALAGGAVAGRYVLADVGRAGELGAMAASGSLTVRVETLPLDLAAEALDRQAMKAVHGKLVLLVA